MYPCILLRQRTANTFVYVYVINLCVFFNLAEGVTAMLRLSTHHVNKYINKKIAMECYRRSC